jgi:SAM-dependent methyltransferase
MKREKQTEVSMEASTGADVNARSTWHYGLIAKWWDERIQGGPDIACVRRFIEAYGEPALDVGCGTGRVLLPLLREGLDVDGADVSADMLALCAARARHAGLEPRLHRQALHELEVPRRYRSMYLCGVFGISDSREHDWEGLRRLHRQLAPQGALLIDHHAPWRSPYLWKYWLPEEQKKLPEPPLGPCDEDPHPISDGSALRLRARVLAFDPEGPSITHEMLAERFVGGNLERSEIRTLHENLYTPNELVLMLERVGFTVVDVACDHSATSSTPDGRVYSIIARK